MLVNHSAVIKCAGDQLLACPAHQSLPSIALHREKTFVLVQVDAVILTGDNRFSIPAEQSMQRAVGHEVVLVVVYGLHLVVFTGNDGFHAEAPINLSDFDNAHLPVASHAPTFSTFVSQVAISGRENLATARTHQAITAIRAANIQIVFVIEIVLVAQRTIFESNAHLALFVHHTPIFTRFAVGQFLLRHRHSVVKVAHICVSVKRVFAFLRFARQFSNGLRRHSQDKAREHQQHPNAKPAASAVNKHACIVHEYYCLSMRCRHTTP